MLIAVSFQSFKKLGFPRNNLTEVKCIPKFMLQFCENFRSKKEWEKIDSRLYPDLCDHV
jgi:hypothetical protein